MRGDRRTTGTRRALRRLAHAAAACAAALVGAAGAESARADTRLGWSFEPPLYTTGTVDGQRGWTGSGGATIDASASQGGVQSLRLTVAAAGADELARISLPETFDATTADSPTLRIRGCFRTDLQNGPAISLLALRAADGTFIGHLRAVAGVYRVGSGIGSAPSAVAVQANSWTAFDFEADFATRTLTAWIDGVLAATGNFENPATTLGTLEFLGLAGPSGYSAFLDDVSVASVAPQRFVTGFEQAAYAAGALAGQDGWTDVLSGDVVVQSSVAATGSQALGVSLDADTTFHGAERALTFDAAAAPSPILRLRADFRTDSAVTTHVSVISLFSPDGFLGQLVALNGSYRLGTGLGTAPAAIAVAADRWTRIDLEVDFALQRLTARVDGRLAATGDFETPTSRLRAVQFGAYGGTTFQAYLDNLSAVVAPPPVYLTGFEAADYGAGALEGSRVVIATSGAEVQTEVAAHGDQALRLAVEGTGAHQLARFFALYEPSVFGMRVLRVSASCRVGGAAAPQVSVFSVLGAQVGALGHLRTVDGIFDLEQGPGNATSSPDASPDTWYRAELDIDFAARAVVARVDDALVGTGELTDPDTQLYLVDFSAVDDGPDYQAYLDDLSVVPLEHPFGPELQGLYVGDWTVGRPYENSQFPVFFAARGTGNIVWTVTGGSLPPGVTLHPGGVLQGAADVAGDFGAEVQAEDAYGFHDRDTVTFRVNPQPEVLTPRLPPAAIGRGYSARLLAQGGTRPLAWQEEAPGLPEGLSVDSETGIVSGEPAAAGTEQRSVSATDYAGATAVGLFDLDVADPVAFSGRSSRKAATVTAEAPRRQVRYVELTAGDVLDVLVTGRFSALALPDLRVLTGQGAPLDLTGRLTVSRAGARLKRFQVAETGRYFLETTVPDGFAGRVTTRVVVTAPSRFAGTVTIDQPGEGGIVEFTAPPGSKLTSIVVRAPRGSDAVPSIVSVLGDDDVDLVPGGTLTGGRRVRFRTSATLDAVRYAIRLEGRDGTVGELSYVVALRVPRAHTFSLPDLPAGDAPKF